MQLQRVPGEPDGPASSPPPGAPPPATSPPPAAPGPDEAATRALAEQGVVLLSGLLTHEKASAVAAAVLGRHRGEKPLTLHVTNVTGSVSIALMLHDLLTTSEVQVRTIGGGMLDVAGALVVAAGSPSERALLPNTRVHVSRIDTPDDDQLDVERAADEVKRLRAVATDALGLDIDHQRILSADEAVAAGIADKISLSRK